MREIVAAYQRSIVPFGGLNLIPGDWLHITLQGVGYVDMTSDSYINDVIAGVSRRVSTLPPLEISFIRPYVLEEAVVIAPEPATVLHELLVRVRSGMNDSVGEVDTSPEQRKGFRPHMSIAYFNSPGQASPYIKALGKVRADPVSVRVDDLELIVQDRVLDPEWVYKWTTHTSVQLGSAVK
ncbi:2'-5' RNA ligase family protein [Allonocardiopsis opalescens]|uniref:2'-5' RNA ligase family protein n=1 Tax=Allonocardiopsis opalescens TaxID=1144618 RepID=UPI001473ADA0|nr:2'-5' RNA ligase family protein [Allonocardiopsis opalescens]